MYFLGCVFYTFLTLLRLWIFFFFKQKTAYEMRISDWSSDVCSSDLISVRDFVRLAAAELGVSLRFVGSGVDEVAVVESRTGEMANALKPGDTIVRVDPRYFRPAEVETLIGDATKAKAVLGWRSEERTFELHSLMRK